MCGVYKVKYRKISISGMRKPARRWGGVIAAWVFLFVFLVVLASALSDAGRCEAAVEWETTLDYSSSFQATSDGGVAFAGRTDSNTAKITKLGDG